MGVRQDVGHIIASQMFELANRCTGEWEGPSHPIPGPAHSWGEWFLHYGFQHAVLTSAKARISSACLEFHRCAAPGVAPELLKTHGWFA